MLLALLALLLLLALLPLLWLLALLPLLWLLLLSLLPLWSQMSQLLRLLLLLPLSLPLFLLGLLGRRLLCLLLLGLLALFLFLLLLLWLLFLVGLLLGLLLRPLLGLLFLPLPFFPLLFPNSIQPRSHSRTNDTPHVHPRVPRRDSARDLLSHKQQQLGLQHDRGRLPAGARSLKEPPDKHASGGGVDGVPVVNDEAATARAEPRGNGQHTQQPRDEVVRPSLAGGIVAPGPELAVLHGESSLIHQHAPYARRQRKEASQ